MSWRLIRRVHVACNAQVKAVQEYLKELLEASDAKMLIFAHHRELLDGIQYTMERCAHVIASCPRMRLHHTLACNITMPSQIVWLRRAPLSKGAAEYTMRKHASRYDQQDLHL